MMAGLEPLPAPESGDLVVVPGFRLRDYNIPSSLKKWLQLADTRGAYLCSVCTGAFVLGEAGLLDNRHCTTHWKRIGELQSRFPKARVVSDRLFVHDRNITTSAGIASGIDMALSFVEQHHGPLVTAAVAREMVIYIRRDGHHNQESIYLSHRTHLHAGIHEVQGWLIAHPQAKSSLSELAGLAGMSPRNLTRTFRQATGVSISEFRTRLRLELARNLLNDPALTMEMIAARSGFNDARHLRRSWKNIFGDSPAQSRRKRSGQDQLSKASVRA